MTIDVGAFTEWILAKAEKNHGVVASNARNIQEVRDLVAVAVGTPAEEIRVVCTLDGASGPVQIEECFTRSALEVLFAEVHVPARRSTVREEPPPTPADVDAPSASERARDARIARNVLIVVALVITAIIASATAWIVGEQRGEHHDTHDKREMHR